MKKYSLSLTQPTDRQTFNRFTTPPEEIDDIHQHYLMKTDAGDDDVSDETSDSASALVHNWRKERDSNPRSRFRLSGFQDRRIRPLCHPSSHKSKLL